MKVTLIKEEFKTERISCSQEKIYTTTDIENLSRIPVGEMADKIRLEIEFTKHDIPIIMKFLSNAEPCFG